MARSCGGTHRQWGFLVLSHFSITDALDLAHLFPWNSIESTRRSEAAERLLSAIKVLPVVFSFSALDASGEHSQSSAWNRRYRVRHCSLNHRRHRCTSVVRRSLGTGLKSRTGFLYGWSSNMLENVSFGGKATAPCISAGCCIFWHKYTTELSS